MSCIDFILLKFDLNSLKAFLLKIIKNDNDVSEKRKQVFSKNSYKLKYFQNCTNLALVIPIFLNLAKYCFLNEAN